MPRSHSRRIGAADRSVITGGQPPASALARVSRREFLATVSASVLAATCSRGRFDPNRFPVPTRSAVGLFAVPSYDVDFSDVIGRGLRELGMDVRGKRVFLKPNMVEYEPGTAINTNPLVVIGAAVAFKA